MGIGIVRGQRGETLAEVLVAVVLASFIVTSLVGTMAIALDSAQRISDVRNLENAVFDAVADLEGAPYSASGYTIGPKNNVPFTVQTSQLTSRLQTVTVTGTFAGLSRTQSVVKSSR